MRKFLFPLLVLAVAGVLWLVEQEGVRGGRTGSSGGGSPNAEESARAAELEQAPLGERRLLHDSRASIPVDENPEDSGFALTIRFLAHPAGALDGATCLLDLETSLDFGGGDDPGGTTQDYLDELTEGLVDGGSLDPDGVLLQPWDDAAVSGQRQRAVLERGHEVRFRIPAGRVWPTLVLGREMLELDSFLMPAEPHVEVIDLGKVRDLRVQVLAGGEPVHPCRMEAWGGNGIDEARLLLEGQTAEGGFWEPRLLFGEVDHLRVIPASSWLRQSFGPIPLDGVEDPLAVELPVGFLELVLPSAHLGSTRLLRLPVEGSPYPTEPPEEFQLEELRSGVARQFLTGPCQLRLLNSARLYRLVGEDRVRAGQHHRVEVMEVRSGLIDIQIQGFGEPVAPAGLEWEPLDGEMLLAKLERQAADSDAGVDFRCHLRAEAGRYRVRVRGPLLIAGSAPPEYRIPLEESWEADLTVEEGRVHSLRFDWDGGTGLIPEFGPGR